MKKLIIKATALTFISVTTVFAAMTNDEGFDQRVEFPELMTIQQEFAEQNASHQLTMNSTAGLGEAINALHTITDDIELAKELANLEKNLAVHLTALGEARSDAKALFNKTKQEFTDNAETVKDIKPIEREIVEVQSGRLNEIKKEIAKGEHIDVAHATKVMLASLKKRGVEKFEFAQLKTDSGISIASVHGFLDTLELNYSSINHHIEVTELLQVIVRGLSMELSTAMVNGSVIEPAVFPDTEILKSTFEGIKSLSIRRNQDISEDDYL